MSGWSDTAEIRKSIEIDAPSDVVYRALVDEKELVHWMPTEARMDLHVGGTLRFRFRWEARNVDTEVVGKIVELVPKKKVAYTWVAAMRSDRAPASMDDAPAALVTWTLEDLRGMRTRVILVQKGFDERFRGDGESGWEHFLAQLKEHCKK
jgi:uncharacterized protein YndB with AHSA1/START domain